MRVFKLTEVTVELLLGDNDLARGCLVSVGDGMVEDANSTNNLSNHARFVLSRDIGWIADNERGASRFFSATHTNGLAIFHEDLVDGSVEHVSATVDGAKS